MLGWFRNRRRRQLMKAPFPAEWDATLRENAEFMWHLDEDAQGHIRRAILVFAHEKNWEGCGGQKMGYVERVTIAAQIARMTLGLENEWFDEVRSILVYPDAYLAKSQDLMGSTLVEGNSARLGEAWYRGPVILSWVDVLATARRENYGRNVVVHEFAHQLDMRNGRQADGIPVIESEERASRWIETMNKDFHRLTAFCQSGTQTILDCYGATNHAEFFAVASEAFFEQPRQLEFEWPDLYQELVQIYGQTPQSQ